MAQLTTRQIATFGSDMQEGIAAGLKNFPIHKLALICYNSDNQKAEEFSRRIRSILGIPVTITLVNGENVIRDVLERVGEIISIQGNSGIPTTLMLPSIIVVGTEVIPYTFIFLLISSVILLIS
jgi:hypothetical protein